MNMNTVFSPRVIGVSRGLLLGLLGSSIAISAQAGGVTVDEDQQTIRVSYAGLDLRDPAAMHNLYGRLKVAARLVCGGDISGVREVQRVFAHRACAQDALETAIKNVDNAALTALHQSELENPVS
jgi:UrcA family protein